MGGNTDHISIEGIRTEDCRLQTARLVPVNVMSNFGPVITGGEYEVPFVTAMMAPTI